MYFATLYHLKRICLLVFGGMLLIGAALMLVGALMIWHATSNWPRADGKLRKFDLQPSKSRHTQVKLDLHYQYTVNGKKFTGVKLSPTTADGEITRWYAERKQREYRVDENVEVFYDPNLPARSFLEIPDLLWDVLVYPISIGCLGAWMTYLFVRTRRRKAPAEVAAQLEGRFMDARKWGPVFESVIERDHVVLAGIASYSGIGGLLAGWPSCRAALVASPNEFAVVPGPYTMRGIASCVVTLVLETSLSRIWLPAIHGTIFLVEIWRRRRNWTEMKDHRFDLLRSDNRGVTSVPIDNAVVYGIDSRKRQLWFRLPGRRMDEFIQLNEGEAERVAEFIGFIDLMQKANVSS